MTGFVDERGAVGVIYLNFSKAFDNISHNILEPKLIYCSMDEWIMNLENNCLADWAQRAMINGPYSGWRLVTSTVLHRSILSCLTPLPIATEEALKFADDITVITSQSFITSQYAWEQGCLTGVPTQKGRNGQTGTLSNSTRTNAKSCTLRVITPCSDTDQALPGWGAALEKGVGCPGEKRAEPEPTVSSSHRGSQQHPGLHQLQPGNWGKLLSPFTQHSLDNIPDKLWTPNPGRTLTNFSEFSSSYQGGLSLQWLPHVGRLGK